MFVAIEFSYGFIANSTALMADAGHNLSDVLGLALAWGAAMLARRAPNRHYTYGLRSSSILAALGNALLLMVACGAIGWEAVQRFSEPAPVAGWTVSIVALVGVAVNGISAWLFMAGSKDDMNIRARLPAHGGRRRDLARRGGVGRGDHVHRLGLDRPGGQHRHRGADRARRPGRCCANRCAWCWRRCRTTSTRTRSTQFLAAGPA